MVDEIRKRALQLDLKLSDAIADYFGPIGDDCYCYYGSDEGCLGL